MTSPRKRSHSFPAAAGLAALFVALGTAAPLEAHRPYFIGTNALEPETALIIAQPAVSWAIYAALPTPDARQYYRFDGEAGQVIFVQLLVPRRSTLRLAPPIATLVGPATLAEIEAAADPAEAGSHRISTVAEDRTDYHESFTQITYDQYPPLRVVLPEDGAYWIVVEAPDDATGNYVLAVGTEEVFGARDIPSFPTWWWNARRHAELPVWHGAALLGAVAVLFVALALSRIGGS